MGYFTNGCFVNPRGDTPLGSPQGTPGGPPEGSPKAPPGDFPRDPSGDPPRTIKENLIWMIKENLIWDAWGWFPRGEGGLRYVPPYRLWV